MQQLKNVLQLIKLGEKLKMELRHSWLSNGRRESVAEHTWRVALMAMAIEPYLHQKVNSERLLKMIIIHDLVEAYAKDIPAFHTMDNAEQKALKRQNEIEAIEKIRDILGDENGQAFYHLWFEFEDKITYEAKIANALDKLEAQIQHNEANIDTWLPIEHEMTFMLQKHTAFDPVLNELKDLIEQEGENKLLAANIDIQRLKENLN
ncbi:HAD family hydrolase [Heyndrickxia shackletonii]|uniref:HAD family hydrolase n=1 Tax=Heyndrickxia shackletonii TaxID=157838 RepID=A0A0Q3WVC8_9BACI|nr:HD domain-containing protein [Heyndrickxia shackletonii]KQL52293.1 HAD family hydrolase [Heyndrickxia shackletonii]MBB2480757.1 HD domain-containing protein [Bacillus sp. APMAM]NEZ00313.1 HD domain-containing protein [Heyndrickxia shackletonii]RTZ55885.1 HD domain-containing protein [Bacillus sp. SAJ1]